MTTALVLSGGGARAAYQVGVLKAVADILPPATYNPFPIICGTSAGAINTLALAGQTGPFASRINGVEQIWRNLSASKVYRTDCFSVFSNTVKILCSLVFASAGINKSLALLDNSPLRTLLEEVIDFRNIDESIASRYLEAVAVTAMSYSTGQSITFFQGDHDNWQRARRMGVRTGLTIDHLMASSAIPTMFLPVRIGNRYFGDGALRQPKPLSPALHLGAERIFVIGVSDNRADRQPIDESFVSPTIAQMMGHMLNSTFIDTMESDLETLRKINDLVEKIPPGQATGDARKIDYLCITPSRAINSIAAEYLHELPLSVRTFLRLTGANTGGSGASSASYLLFEPGFCGELIDMGYRDTLQQQQEVLNFFTAENATAGQLPARG